MAETHNSVAETYPRRLDYTTWLTEFVEDGTISPNEYARNRANLVGENNILEFLILPLFLALWRRFFASEVQSTPATRSTFAGPPQIASRADLKLRFLGLETYKQESPELAELLSALEVFMRELLDRQDFSGDLNPTLTAILPQQVSERLNIDEGLALVLLKVFDELGIVVPRYELYCPVTRNFLEAFDSVNELPSRIDCPFEERITHGLNDYLVELIFNFSPTVSNNPVAITRASSHEHQRENA